MNEETQSQLGIESIPNVPEKGNFVPTPEAKPYQAKAQGFLSLAQASQVTGYHQDYLSALARSGKLAATKIGRNWVVSQEALDKLLAEVSGSAVLENTHPALDAGSSPSKTPVFTGVEEAAGPEKNNLAYLKSQKFLVAMLISVLFLPAIINLVHLQDKLNYAREKTNSIIVGTQNLVNQKVQEWLRKELAKLGIGNVILSGAPASPKTTSRGGKDLTWDSSVAPQNDKGGTVSGARLDNRNADPETSSGGSASQKRDPEINSGLRSQAGTVAGLSISNDDFITSLRNVIAAGLPDDVKASLTGPAGPQGPIGLTSQYIPNSGSVFGVTAPAAEHPGTIGSTTFGSADQFVARTLTVTGSTDISGPTTLGSTTINGVLNVSGAQTNLATLSVSGAANFSSLSLSGTLTSNGQLIATRAPTLPHSFSSWPAGTSNVSNSTLYINPVSAVADSNLFGAAVNGSVKFLVDAEGDIYGTNLVLSGSTTTGATTIAGSLTVQDNTQLGDAGTDIINPVGAFSNHIRLLKTNTATAITQYPSYDVRFQASSWDTTLNGGLGGESTNNIILRNIGQSGAGASYRLGILNDGTASELVSILQNGNVGIGTTTPAYSLDVLGTIGNNGYRAITIPSQTVIGISTTGTETGFNLGLLNYNLFIGDGGTLNTVVIGAGNPIDPLSFETAGLVNGLYNTFTGVHAGLDNTTGNFNTFLGSMAGQNNANGDQNTFIGAVAGQLNTSGYRNTYIGVGAGQSSNGFLNTYIGTDNHLLSTSGSYNTSVGIGAGLSTSGSYNADFGFQSLQYTTGSNNSAFGVNSLNNDTSGSSNVAIGYYAGATLTGGSNNTFLGNQSDVTSGIAATVTNSSAIGNGVVLTKSNQVILGNTSITETLLNGLVGIGGTPTQKLEVAGGNIQIPNNYGLLGRSADTTSINLIGVNGSDEMIIGSGNKYVGLTFSTGGANGSNMVRFTNGNVGIGTTNPANYKLQVTALGASGGVSFGGSLNGGTAGSDYDSIGYNFRTTSSTGVYNYNLADTSSRLEFYNGGYKFKGTATVGVVGNPVTYSDFMTILNTGNVGIAVAVPREKLDVAGNMVVDWTDGRRIGAEYSDGSAYQIGLSFDTTNRGTRIDALAADASYISFRTGTVGSPSERMRITTTGNVGIGTTGPSYKLQVEGSIAIASAYNGMGNGVERYIGVPGNGGWSGGGAFIGFTQGGTGTVSNDIRFYTHKSGVSAAERVRIDEAGNVGIGTTNPSTDKLVVVGDIRVGTSGTNGCVEQFAGTALVGACSSDIRLKQNIQPITGILDKFTQLQPVTYQWRAGEFPDRHFGSDPVKGLIAQDVEKLFPELVGIDARGFKTVDYGIGLQMMSIEAIKELNNKLSVIQNSLGGITPQIDPQGVILSNIRMISSISGKWSIDENGVLVAKKARLNDLEIVDRKTGEVYCLGIENGEWIKTKGECGQIQSSGSVSDTVPQAPEATFTPTEPVAGSDSGSITQNTDTSPGPEPTLQPPLPEPQPAPSPVTPPTEPSNP